VNILKSENTSTNALRQTLHSYCISCLIRCVLLFTLKNVSQNSPCILIPDTNKILKQKKYLANYNKSLITYSCNEVENTVYFDTKSLLLLLRLALQPAVGFGLLNNTFPFLPIYHQLSPSSHSHHLKISFYFFSPSFPGSSSSSHPFQFLSKYLSGHPILLHSLQVTQPNYPLHLYPFYYIFSRDGSSPSCLKYIIRVKIDSQNTTSICWFFYLFVRVTTCFSPN